MERTELSSPLQAEAAAGFIIGVGTSATGSRPPASGQRAAHTVACCLTAEQNVLCYECSININITQTLVFHTPCSYDNYTTTISRQPLGRRDPCPSPKTTTRVRSQNLPGCIDPDYIQVAEVVALRVQLVAAGTALGPRPVRRRAAGSLPLLLSRHWKGQTWWETLSR